MRDRGKPALLRAVADAASSAVRFVLFGNLFLAGCATVWTFSTYRMLGLPPSSVNPWLLALVFGGVVVVYISDRLFTFETYAPASGSGRHRWIERNRRPLTGLLSIAAAVTLVSLAFVRPSVVALLAALGAVSLAYSIPVLENATVGLKSVGFLKIFLVAAVWAAVTTLLVPLDAGATLASAEVWLLAVERFLFVFAITLPFDVRDASLDASLDIRTIPVRIGARGSRWLVGALLVAFLALKLDHYAPDRLVLVVPAALSTLYALALLATTADSESDYVYSLLWDGAIFVQALLTLFFA